MSHRALLLTLSILLSSLAIPAALSLGAPEAPAAPVKHAMPVFDASRVAAPSLRAQAAASNNMVYGGGSIQKIPKVYIVLWCWNGADPSSEAPYLQNFFNGVGGSAWMQPQTQYTETARGAITNPTGQLKGVWADNSCTVPPVPDLQIGSEALKAATHFGYDKDANYIIATPHLHNDAQFGVPGGYCAWHSSTTDTLGRPVAYTDLPYIPDAQGGVCGQNFVNAGAAGNLDGVSIVGGHEYAEAVTDPVPTSGWADASGQENGDKCAWISSGPGASHNIVLSTGTFAIQTLWSNAISGCAG